MATRMERLETKRKKEKQRRSLKVGAVSLVSALALVSGTGAAFAGSDDTLIKNPDSQAMNLNDNIKGLTGEELDKARDTALGLMSGEVKKLTVSDKDAQTLKDLGISLDLSKSKAQTNAAIPQSKDYHLGKQAPDEPYLQLTGSVNKKTLEAKASSIAGDDYEVLDPDDGFDMGLITLNDTKMGVGGSNIAEKGLIDVSSLSKGKTFADYQTGRYSPKSLNAKATDDGDEYYAADAAATLYPGFGISNQVPADERSDWMGSEVYDQYSDTLIDRGNNDRDKRNNYLKLFGAGQRGLPEDTFSNCIGMSADFCGIWVVPTAQVQSTRANGPSVSEHIALSDPIWIGVESTVSAGKAPYFSLDDTITMKNGGKLWFLPTEQGEGSWYDDRTDMDQYGYFQTLNMAQSFESQKAELKAKLDAEPALIIDSFFNKNGKPNLKISSGGDYSVFSGATLHWNDDKSFTLEGGVGQVLRNEGQGSGGVPYLFPLSPDEFYSAANGNKVFIDSNEKGKLVGHFEDKDGNRITGSEMTSDDIASLNYQWSLPGIYGSKGFGYEIHYKEPKDTTPEEPTTPPTDEPEPPTETPEEPTTPPTDKPEPPTEPTTPTETPDKPDTPTDTPDEPQKPSETPEPKEPKEDTPTQTETVKDAPDDSGAMADDTKVEDAAINAGSSTGVKVGIITTVGLLVLAVATAIVAVFRKPRNVIKEATSPDDE